MAGDMIVVGSGSAGTPIAVRTTEKGDRDVLLLEAGPDYPDIDQLPQDLVDGTRNSMQDHDWGLYHRVNRRQLPFVFPRGKVVGGSSSVNTCIALRGQPYDYDEWAALGLPEWSWEKCLPAFKAFENDLDFDNEWHSQRGPIPIRRHAPHELVTWQAGFLEACRELGYDYCPDHNDPTTTGYGPHAMNKIDGVRQSVARCYLTPEVRRRSNFTLQAETLVRRVCFENKRVSGVEVERRGEVTVLPAKTVVLSGGSVLTPGILLRSGIGPRDDLARLSVEPVAENAGVGVRLLDHPGAAFIMASNWGVSNPADPLIQTVMRFTSRGSDCPNDMQLQPGSHLPLTGVVYPTNTMMICVGKPRGSGTIRFKSADPSAKPIIESCIMEHPDDRKRAVEALQLGWLACRQKPLKDLAVFFWPNEPTLRDAAKLEEFLPMVSGSGYHPSGTVPMGPDGDPQAALDQYGRVRGVEGLYVADASIMPTIPSSNTNLPTLMIGERFGAWFRDGVLS